MYKTEFVEQHKKLAELVEWLKTWDKYNGKSKRTNESDESINRKRQHRNDGFGYGEHDTE